jgi:molecular chaperone DnaJ
VAAQDWVNKDFYKVLGVPKNASQADIKKAYRKLAQDLHPDRNPDNHKAETRFKEVSEAYSVVGNDAKRKEYDEARALYGSGGFRFPGAGGGAGGPGAGGGFSSSINLEDLLRRAGSGAGNLGDFFGRFGGGAGRTAGTPGGGTRQFPRRGADVETDVTLGFDDSLEGTTVALRLAGEGPCQTCHGTGAKAGTTPRVCEQCEGAGQVVRNQGGFAIPEVCPQCLGRGLTVDDPCQVCKGSGRAMSSRTVQARIPAGVKDGQRVRLPGKGAPGEFGGPGGDLIVTVHVTPHAVFGRLDDHVTVTVPITFDEAALGGEIEVPSPGGGLVKLKVPPGTANGRTFRVRGRGMRRRDATKGDLLVTVEVAVPSSSSTDAREALEAYRSATTGFNPRADLLAAAAGAGRPRPAGG